MTERTSIWWRALPAMLARDRAVVLVSVAQVAGSAPREAGASMLISAHTAVDTIGGGHLEWEAMARAREMIADGSRTALLRFPLSASLGQCCGGVVWLLFERISESAAAWRARVAQIDAGNSLWRQADEEGSHWTVIPADAGTHRRRKLRDTLSGPDRPVLSRSNDGNDSQENGPAWQFTQTIAPPDFHVTLFGAGHVGEAIVRALLPLHAQITWVDTREDVFPAGLPDTVQCCHSDTPEDFVHAAEPGCLVLVLTHSHAIDLDLCAVGLMRDDLGFFGLIGSPPKRTRFLQRLTARGLPPEALARLTCPIGIAGIVDKQPAVIAASVVAQLLQVRSGTSPSTPLSVAMKNQEKKAAC